MTKQHATDYNIDINDTQFFEISLLTPELRKLILSIKPLPSASIIKPFVDNYHKHPKLLNYISNIKDIRTFDWVLSWVDDPVKTKDFEPLLKLNFTWAQLSILSKFATLYRDTNGKSPLPIALAIGNFQYQSLNRIYKVYTQKNINILSEIKDSDNHNFSIELDKKQHYQSNIDKFNEKNISAICKAVLSGVPINLITNYKFNEDDILSIEELYHDYKKNYDLSDEKLNNVIETYTNKISIRYAVDSLMLRSKYHARFNFLFKNPISKLVMYLTPKNK